MQNYTCHTSFTIMAFQRPSSMIDYPSLLHVSGNDYMIALALKVHLGP
jgi:hypothetical protein